MMIARCDRPIVALMVLALGATCCSGKNGDGDDEDTGIDVVDSGSDPDVPPDVPDVTDDEVISDPVVEDIDEEEVVVGCVDSAAGTFPGTAVELAWETDGGNHSIADYTWSPIVGYAGSYVITEEPMWEAVRFNMDAPATIYGARIQWDKIPWDETAVTAGGYRDFGSNGFDFWQWEPLWEGTRCLTYPDSGDWIDYVFDEPIEMDLPGYFFMAHFIPGPAVGEPLFMMDGDVSVDCDVFDNCASSINMPEADAAYYYNGISMRFPYPFAVRLMVELHDTIPPEDKWFQIDDTLRASSRVAWGDYNNDGFDDLMTNGPVLYRNEGDGTFTDVTTDAGLDSVGGSTNGGVWGDYDNDGCLDYFGQGGGYTGPEVLLNSNCDGTFTDVTATAGIEDLQSDVDCDSAVAPPENSPTEGSAWVDLDADGYLDLYLAEHICWSAEEYYIDKIWHNEGDGTFTDWTSGHGFAAITQRAGRGVSPIDYDRDGDMDVFVSNYRLHANFFFENHGSGSFSEIALTSGLAGYAVSGYYGHTIGSVWVDVENDGDFDLIESNLAHPRFYDFSDRLLVMINDGFGSFGDNSDAAGIHYRETHSNPTVADFDLDGDWDLFVTAIYDGRFSEMYLNDGDGTFTQVNYESGAIIHNGWGSAASDYDNDGDVDLVAYDLFRNDTAALGSWLQVRALGGPGINASGIGSIVKVTAGSTELLSHTSGGSGTGCQDSMFLTFGLGSTLTVDSIEVEYPGGSTATLTGPIDANQRVWIYADGTVTYGWSP